MGCEFKARKLNHCAVSHKMDFGENTHRTTEPYKTCGFGTLGREVARKSQGNETSVENTSAESCSASIWTCGMNPGKSASQRSEEKKTRGGLKQLRKIIVSKECVLQHCCWSPIVHLSSKHCKGGKIHSRFVSKMLKMHGTVPGPWPCCTSCPLAGFQLMFHQVAHRSALAFVGGVTLAVFHYSCRGKFCGIKASVHKDDTKHRTC